MESAGNEENDVVDHVTVSSCCQRAHHPGRDARDIVEEGGEGLSGLAADVVELLHELLCGLLGDCAR